MALLDLLTTVSFDPSAQVLVGVDPTTRFVIVAGENGPERVDSAYRKVDVPMFDWQASGIDEDATILKVLLEASMANPLKLPNPATLDDNFWIRQRGWRGMVFNPALFGRFLIPDWLEVIQSEVVAPSQLLLVGNQAGFYVVQGERRGVVSNRLQGLMQVQFSVV